MKELVSEAHDIALEFGAEACLIYIRNNISVFPEIEKIVSNVFNKVCGSKELLLAYHLKDLAAGVVVDNLESSGYKNESLYGRASFYLEDFDRCSSLLEICKGSDCLLPLISKFLSEDIRGGRKFLKAWGDYYNSGELAKIVEGKSVCVVGPADTGVKNGDEIDSYDVVVRMNFTSSDDIVDFSESHGKRTDITYFNSILNYMDECSVVATGKELKLGGVHTVFRNRAQHLAFGHKVGCSSVLAGAPRIFSSSFSYHGMQRAIIDLLRFNPGKLKVFNVDFFTGAAGGGSNRISTYKTAGGDIGFGHDPLQGFRFAKYLNEIGVVDFDCIASEVLGWRDLTYVSHMEGLLKRNKKFVMNRNLLNR